MAASAMRCLLRLGCQLTLRQGTRFELKIVLVRLASKWAMAAFDAGQEKDRCNRTGKPGAYGPVKRGPGERKEGRRGKRKKGAE